MYPNEFDYVMATLHAYTCVVCVVASTNKFWNPNLHTVKWGIKHNLAYEKLSGVFRDTRFDESSHTTAKIRNTLCGFFSFLKYVAVCGWKRIPGSSAELPRAERI